jgi:hypothetical protein
MRGLPVNTFYARSLAIVLALTLAGGDCGEDRAQCKM